MATPDNEMAAGLGALKEKLRQTWCEGNYANIAQTLAPSTLSLLQRHPVTPGAEVLDVACGAGQIAIPAARAGARVTGIDIADNLIEQARTRAAEENLTLQLDVGDAESLPYADDSFDQIYSVIGAMFAPRPERVAAELTRVTRSGGRIVMANWTPEGFVGRFFATLGRHVPPPEQMPSPLIWGTEAGVRERFAHVPAELRMEKRMFEFRYPYSESEVVDFYREYFGPVRQAFRQLDTSGQEALREDLVSLWSEHNLARDGTVHTRAEVLEIVVVPAEADK